MPHKSKIDTHSISSTKKPIKVGFDFDGVIMYNPARIIRPIVSFFKKKKLLIHRKDLEFFIPKNRFQRSFWWLLHQSSVIPAIGIKEIKQLVDAGEIEAYVITGRYDFLKKDFERWFKRINGKKIFKEWYVNEKNEQPHLFKQRKIQELGLDFFIEDNWDIVHFLHRKLHINASEKKVTIFWIFNILDRKIEYRTRFSQLHLAIKHLKQEVLHIQKPRVLAISDYFYPHWTGLSKSVFQTFSALSDRFEIEVLTVKHQSKLKKRELINGFWIQRARPLLQLSRAYYAPSIVARIWKKTRHNDIVFINSPCTNIFPAAVLGKLMGKKVVIFHQGDLLLPAGFMNRVIETVFTVMTLVAFSLADRLSTYTKDYAQHSRVLRYFLYKTQPTIFPVPSLPATTIKKNTSKKQTPTFGFAGRFVEEKGFDILFQAIPDIVEQIPDARFVFAGQTKMQYETFYEKHLQDINKVKKYLDFLGLLKDEELSQFYQSLDFFLLTSRSECFGLVQAESMLAGTPVICSNIPGARELVRKTKFGMLFETENASDLADTVIKAYKIKDTIMENKTRAQEFLSYDKLVTQSEKLFIF